MKKPYIERFYISTWSDSFKRIRADLNHIGADFKYKEFLAGFWGIEFTVQKFSGRGSAEKNKQIEKILKYES